MQIAFRNHLNHNLPFLKGKKILLAVSGGIDSVVLTHLLKKLKFNFSLAHCNFKLRGKESNKDEQFVIALGKTLNVPSYTIQFDTEDYAKDKSISTQMAARALRYDWFQELCTKYEYDYVLTAHHKEDIFETVLMNLTRGTGLEGLTGIPEMNGNIIRPLLPFTRNDIIVYASRHKIQWREDVSNSSIKYARNKIRHKIVPVLKELNPNLLITFDETLEHLKGSKRMVEDQVQHIFKKTSVIKGNDIHFNIKKLKKLSTPKNYLFEILHPYGFTEFKVIDRLLDAQTGKVALSPSHQLLRNRGELILSPLNTETILSYEILEDDLKINIPIKLRLKKIKLNSKDSSSIEKLIKRENAITIDSDLLLFPLTLRKWKSGDFFYPIGLDGKKKISKYFKDEKMSLNDKENTWLLCSGNDIVWVIGKRMDDRFKLTSKSSNALRIQLKLEK